MSKEESFTYEEYLDKYNRRPEPEKDLAKELADITITLINDIFKIIKESSKGCR